MGVVYRAHDPAIGRTVAIKVIRFRELTDESERERLRDRLRREARLAGILSHPNIVTIYDVGEEGDTAYIAIEFVNGPTLQKLMSSGAALLPQQCLSILSQTAAALDYAHGKAIVHRDIKPSNIMLDENGAAKVTDFGVARIISTNLTQSGGLLGTPSYMSPEQVAGAAVEGSSDQFALAAVAYELLTGKKPFEHDSLPALLYMIVHDDPPSAAAVNPSLNQGAANSLARGLAKNPKARFSSCSAFVAALESACGVTPNWKPQPAFATADLPTVDTRSIPAVSPQLPGRRSRRWLWAALAAVLIAGSGVFLINRPVAQPPVTEDIPVALPAQPVPAVPRPDNAPVEAPPQGAAQQALPESPVPPPSTPEPLPSPPSGPFEVTTYPAGAQIVFDADSTSRCAAPCRTVLSRGRHTFVVRLDGYRETQRIIDIPHDTGLIIDLVPLTGVLMLTTVPSGLPVFIDGREQQQRSPASFTLPVGQHRVTVTRGSQQQQFTVEVRDGITVTRTLEWLDQ